MKLADVLPMPFVSGWDPKATASGSIDPLGALRSFTAIATTLLPGVTTVTSRVRYLSWVCAGLRLLDELPNVPTGGRAGRARRQRLLAWERILALATGTYARAKGATEEDNSWYQLRGVSYVRRAVAEGVLSPEFPMLRNQAGVGGVGTYWVTLVAGGLVENDDAGALTPQGVGLADIFLRRRATPDRSQLHRVLSGEDIAFNESVLAEWGHVVHLGAASTPERRLLADALLEPVPHRWMKLAMKERNATASDGDTFRSLAKHLGKQGDLLATQLAGVLAIASSFEDLHRELLYRFNQVRAHLVSKVPLKNIHLARGDVALSDLGDALKDAQMQHDARMSHSVREAVRDFAIAVEPVVRAKSDTELIELLVRHHERVQAGKLDASRQPKIPWMKLDGKDVVVTPRYALENRPEKPNSREFTHPYRIEQFMGMLLEAGVWESAS